MTIRKRTRTACCIDADARASDLAVHAVRNGVRDGEGGGSHVSSTTGLEGPALDANNTVTT